MFIKYELHTRLNRYLNGEPGIFNLVRNVFSSDPIIDIDQGIPRGLKFQLLFLPVLSSTHSSTVPVLRTMWPFIIRYSDERAKRTIP